MKWMEQVKMVREKKREKKEKEKDRKVHSIYEDGGGMGDTITVLHVSFILSSQTAL